MKKNQDISAFCHRDYKRPEGNKVAIFKDRVEIYNPGKFPKGYDPNDFITQSHESILRNPLIANILYLCKKIEKWGSGLKRIHDECKKSNVKVEHKKLKDGFKIIFYRNLNTNRTQIERKKTKRLDCIQDRA